ncbi:MAG TPA: hypothetical protein VIW25_01185 [Nitrososphaeraceae archaeon]
MCRKTPTGMPPLPSRITDAAASAGYSGNAFKYDIALSSSAALFAYNRVILLSMTHNTKNA